MLKRIYAGLEWRWQLAKRVRYLKNNFQNGEELARSYRERTACDVAVRRDGSSIRHPPGRIGLAGMLLEVWYEEVYTGRFYSPAKGDIVIDAGANIGLFSLLIASRQPDCNVFAFEPFEENFQILNSNLASAGATAVRTFRKALSGQSGFAAIKDGGSRSQDHIVTTSAEIEEPRNIQTCSLSEVLDTVNSETIHMFKCDIEGSEYDLFVASREDELLRIERFAIEYHNNIRPGTLELIVDKLSPSYNVDVQPASDAYGMLYAKSKKIRQ